MALDELMERLRSIQDGIEELQTEIGRQVDEGRLIRLDVRAIRAAVMGDER